MVRRVIHSSLSGYSRLPGSAKRYRTPTGETISERSYRKLADAARLKSNPSIKAFESALAKHNGDIEFARDASGISKRQFDAYRRNTTSEANPFTKEHGRYVFTGIKTRFHAFIGDNGRPQYEVAFAGDNLTAMRELREAIERRDQRALDDWKRKYPNGIADRFGQVHHPETNLRKLNAAKRRMSPAERAYFASREHYGSKDVSEAA